MNTMLVGLLCTFVLLVTQAKGSSIRSKRFTVPSDCKLQAGSTACVQNYLCGMGDYKTPMIVRLFCVPASQAQCAVPLVPGQCGKQICPCVDHKGKQYGEGEQYWYGEPQVGAGELFNCTCVKDNKICGAVCERIEIVPVQKPKPPPTFPPFPFPPGFGR